MERIGRPRVRVSNLTGMGEFLPRLNFFCRRKNLSGHRLMKFSAENFYSGVRISHAQCLDTVLLPHMKKAPEGLVFMCGEREIRTPEGCNTLPPFQGGGINHYPTSPKQITRASSSICLVDNYNVPQRK
jgi:hypothetical protein